MDFFCPVAFVVRFELQTLQIRLVFGVIGMRDELGDTLLRKVWIRIAEEIATDLAVAEFVGHVIEDDIGAFAFDVIGQYTGDFVVADEEDRVFCCFIALFAVVCFEIVGMAFDKPIVIPRSRRGFDGFEALVDVAEAIQLDDIDDEGA